MDIQENLRCKLRSPINHIGASDHVTGTDLRRFADNVASVLAGSCSVCVTGTVAEPLPTEPALQPGKVAAAEAAAKDESEGNSE